MPAACYQGARSRPALTGSCADLFPEPNQQPSDHVVAKRAAGAFTKTNLAA